ncbi:MAG: hypothetical protein ABR985_18195 [Methanotrichaceae archaeon]|jgi:hypothetical protein
MISEKSTWLDSKCLKKPRKENDKNLHWHIPASQRLETRKRRATPSEHAKVVVAAMFEELAKAKAKELHIVSQKEQGDIFQKGDEFGYGPVFPSAFLWM